MYVCMTYIDVRFGHRKTATSKAIRVGRTNSADP